MDPLTLVEPPETIHDNAAMVDKMTAHLPISLKKKDPFAYRQYHALYPNCNKLLAQKWDMTRRQQHLKKLAAARPDVDNTAPKVYHHLQVNYKKLQMEQGKQFAFYYIIIYNN